MQALRVGAEWVLSEGKTEWAGRDAAGFLVAELKTFLYHRHCIISDPHPSLHCSDLPSPPKSSMRGKSECEIPSQLLKQPEEEVGFWFLPLFRQQWREEKPWIPLPQPDGVAMGKNCWEIRVVAGAGR